MARVLYDEKGEAGRLHMPPFCMNCRGMRGITRCMVQGRLNYITAWQLLILLFVTPLFGSTSTVPMHPCASQCVFLTRASRTTADNRRTVEHVCTTPQACQLSTVPDRKDASDMSNQGIHGENRWGVNSH